MNFGGDHSAHGLQFGQAPRGRRSGVPGWPSAPAPGRVPALPVFPKCDRLGAGSAYNRFYPVARRSIRPPHFSISGRGCKVFCGLSASFGRLQGIPHAVSERSLEGASIYEADHRLCRRTRRSYAWHGGGVVVRMGVRPREGRAADDRRIPRAVPGQGRPPGDHLGAHGLETRHRGEPREGALHARPGVRQLRNLHPGRR